MSGYRRVLAFVTVTVDAEAVVRRAVRMARLHGASLALATVADVVPGFECDRYPVTSGDELKRAIAADLRARLDRLLVDAQGAGEIIVVCGETRDAVAHTLRSWRPDLVVVAGRADHGVPTVANGRFDALTVGEPGRPGYAGRMWNALASML
ncbi:MAG: universal stress protein [Burkholderiales bacterium]